MKLTDKTLFCFVGLNIRYLSMRLIFAVFLLLKLFNRRKPPRGWRNLLISLFFSYLKYSDKSTAFDQWYT